MYGTPQIHRPRDKRRPIGTDRATCEVLSSNPYWKRGSVPDLASVLHAESCRLVISRIEGTTTLTHRRGRITEIRFPREVKPNPPHRGGTTSISPKNVVCCKSTAAPTLPYSTYCPPSVHPPQTRKHTGCHWCPLSASYSISK